MRVHCDCQIQTWSDTIRAVRIIVYLAAFAAVIGIAVAIAGLSIVVAPIEAKRPGLVLLAIALSGLGVAGGVVYLAEKLINLAKEVAFMVTELIVEKYQRHRWEAGWKAASQAWQAWYERMQEAQRQGCPFEEPPPAAPEDRNGR